MRNTRQCTFKIKKIMSSAPILKHYPPVNTTFDPPQFSLNNTFKVYLHILLIPHSFFLHMLSKYTVSFNVFSVNVKFLSQYTTSTHSENLAKDLHYSTYSAKAHSFVPGNLRIRGRRPKKIDKMFNSSTALCSTVLKGKLL